MTTKHKNKAKTKIRLHKKFYNAICKEKNMRARAKKNLSMQSANGEKVLGCITIQHTRAKTKENYASKQIRLMVQKLNSITWKTN